MRFLNALALAASLVTAVQAALSRRRWSRNPSSISKEAGKYKGDRTLYRARLTAALDLLKADERTDAKKIAAIGYCFGGTGALELARSGADIAGVLHRAFQIGSRSAWFRR